MDAGKIKMKLSAKYIKVNETHIKRFFLRHNIRDLISLQLSHARQAGRCFMDLNLTLKTIDCPRLQYIENYFLYSNISILSIKMPNLKVAGNSILRFNNTIKEFKAPKLQELGPGSFCYAPKYFKLEAPLLNS